MFGLIEKSIKTGQTQPMLVNNIRIGRYTEKRRLIGVQEYRKKLGNIYYMNEFTRPPRKHRDCVRIYSYIVYYKTEGQAGDIHKSEMIKN